MPAPFYNSIKENPQSFITQFLAIKSPQDLTALLEFKYSSCIYFRYVKTPYEEFAIPKKSGGSRVILAPNSGLKEVQRRLNKVLQISVNPKSCTHGFINGRSIISNARMHVGQKHVLNFDLEDFFPSIHFGRVKGVFCAPPFSFDEETSSFIANLCCFEGKLPQGAPTSPIISNFICRKLDNLLLSYCIQNRCTYTRYADDITISTSQKKIPETIGVAGGKFLLSDSLAGIVNSSGFKINSKKTRLSFYSQQQKVTGIKVNKVLNVDRKLVREVRAMLNNWKNHGIEKVQEDLNTKYSKAKDIFTNREFIRVLRGKLAFIGQVKGVDNPTYRSLLAQARALDSTFRIGKEMERFSQGEVVIYCEGKTDWKHLKKAYQILKSNYTQPILITFKEWKDSDKMNNTELLKICDAASKLIQTSAIAVFLFDNDSPEILKKVTADGPFKHWGNKVYSMVLPSPDHRKDLKQFSIEHFYLDVDLLRKDNNGRRIFFAREFDKRTRRHKELLTLNCASDKFKIEDLTIIDSDVYNENLKNVALSKSDLATNILESKNGFEQIDFSHFTGIYSLVNEIARSTEKL
jgi:RNA-directed DNA polymerase